MKKAPSDNFLKIHLSVFISFALILSGPGFVLAMADSPDSFISTKSGLAGHVPVSQPLAQPATEKFTSYKEDLQQLDSSIKNLKDSEDFVVIKNKSPLEMFEDADYLYQLGQYENALILYNKIVTQANDPALKRKAELARETIDTLLRSERVEPKRSTREFRRAERIKERRQREELAYLTKRAFNYFYGKDYKKSLETFKKILELDPHNAEAGDYVAFKIPQAEEKDRSAFLSKRALVYFENRDFKNATETFKAILEINPEDAQAKQYLDVKIPEARNQVLVKSYYGKALSIFQTGDYKASLEAFKKVLLLDSRDASAMEFVNFKIPQIMSFSDQAVAYFDSKDYQDALKASRAVLEINPQDQRALEYVNVRIPEAQKQGQIESLYREAISAFQAKNYDVSLEVFNKVLVLDPHEILAKNYVAFKIPEARKKQERMNVLFKQVANDLDNRQYASAIKVCKSILEIDPRDEQAVEYLYVKIPQAQNQDIIKSLCVKALDAFQNKDYLLAKRFFKKILILDRNDETARLYLEKKIPPLLGKSYEKKEQAWRIEQKEYLKEVRLAEKKEKEKLKKMILIKAKEKGPVGYLYWLALKNYNKGEFEKAGDCFKKILALYPQEYVAKGYLRFFFR